MILLGIRNIFSYSQLLLIEELYLNGKVVLSIVSERGIINAISFIINSPSEYLVWIDMYDDSKIINLYNYISYISLKSVDNKVCINFGRGAYSYKISNFAPEIRELYALYIFSSKSLKIRYIIKNYYRYDNIAL
jgi:hypothetical protein